MGWDGGLTSFGEIEKPICANGGYSKKVYHGKLMAKVRVRAGRM